MSDLVIRIDRKLLGTTPARRRLLKTLDGDRMPRHAPDLWPLGGKAVSNRALTLMLYAVEQMDRKPEK